MRNSRLPSWLYEALPYLYVGAGLSTVFAIDNVFASASGLLLIAAGLVVWRLRHQYRSCRRFGRGGLQPSWAVDDTRSDQDNGRRRGADRLVWRREYECGIPAVDAQHRGLFEAANALLNAIAEGQSRLDVMLMFDDLVAQMEGHFRDEDELWRQAACPACNDHQERHRQLLAQAKDLDRRCHQGEVPLHELFTFVSGHIIVRHIVDEDHKMAMAAA